MVRLHRRLILLLAASALVISACGSVSGDTALPVAESDELAAEAEAADNEDTGNDNTDNDNEGAESATNNEATNNEATNSKTNGEAVVVSHEELQELLSGNTIVGEWFGNSYRQFFDSDGSTIYAQTGSQSSLGQWRVNPETGDYESWWNSLAGWEVYQVTRIGDEFFWTGEGVVNEPFTIIEGQRLVEEQA